MPLELLINQIRPFTSLICSLGTVCTMHHIRNVKLNSIVVPRKKTVSVTTSRASKACLCYIQIVRNVALQLQSKFNVTRSPQFRASSGRKRKNLVVNKQNKTLLHTLSPLSRVFILPLISPKTCCTWCGSKKIHAWSICYQWGVVPAPINTHEIWSGVPLSEAWTTSSTRLMCPSCTNGNNNHRMQFGWWYNNNSCLYSCSLKFSPHMVHLSWMIQAITLCCGIGRHLNGLPMFT